MEPSLEQKIAELEELFSKLGQVFAKSAMHEADFSKQQIVLLRTLYAKKRTTVSELAEELNLSVSATTIALNRLVKSGHVIRTRDETDRRIVWVEISGQAIELIRHWNQRRAQFLAKLIGHLEPAEQDQFIGLLKKMLLQEVR
jgi:DNA-binding MarR family transcriptional regulator